MEVYILDSLLRRDQVVDRFVSLIWSERFSAYGDFQLDLLSTLENRSRFSTGTCLTLNDSTRIMTVESIENHNDNDGRNILTLKGRSLEYILENRIARGSLSNLTIEPKWIITGPPMDLANKLFHDICVTGILDHADIIPGVIESSFYSTDTIWPSPDSITYEIEPQTLYSALKNLCVLYDMGFRLVRNPSTNLIHFDVYMGSDRTTQQSTLPAVIFSPDLENLNNTSELTSIAGYKNTAYVVSPVGSEIVYPLDVDPNITGFERNVLLVKADDIKDTDPEMATAKMIQRGKEELSKNRRFFGFDGEISPYTSYKYGIDYNLGDLVEQRNVDGITNFMQVVEQIFTSDKEGDKSYPTLALNTFITPGSWRGWDYNQVWEDVGPTEYWANQS